METNLPIYGHTSADFDLALKQYRSAFSSPPPGSGRSEARYQMIRSALEIGEPATLSDLDRWEKEIELLKAV